MTKRFRNMSKFEACGMAEAMKTSKTRRHLDAIQGNLVNKRCAELREKHPHTRDVRLNQLFWYMARLGYDKMVELAQENLSRFLFEQACKKSLGLA